jgi:ribosome biogenesis GTPase / thiamine phosphate phosphatase
VMEPRLAVYEQLGYRVVRVASKADPQGAVAALSPLLAGRTTLLLGQSGMGKSTLVNLLVPGADMATQAISEVLQAGRHTTTFTRAFELPGHGGWLIDSPGFQLFGIAHLSATEVEHGMREFKPLLGQCRFYNCTHLREPGCAIRSAVADGAIDARRHALYAQLLSDRASWRS